MHKHITELVAKYRKPVENYIIMLAVVSIGQDIKELESYLVSCEKLQKQDLLNAIDIFSSWEWNEGIITCMKEIERRGFAESSAERFDL